MSEEEMKTELARFNALDSEEASKLLEAAEGQEPDFRSCWYCNGAHEHLKNRAIMLCFACGLYYIAGYPAGAVVLRAKGEYVTEANMIEFANSLADA